MISNGSSHHLTVFSCIEHINIRFVLSILIDDDFIINTPWMNVCGVFNLIESSLCHLAISMESTIVSKKYQKNSEKDTNQNVMEEKQWVDDRSLWHSTWYWHTFIYGNTFLPTRTLWIRTRPFIPFLRTLIWSLTFLKKPHDQHNQMLSLIMRRLILSYYIVSMFLYHWVSMSLNSAVSQEWLTLKPNCATLSAI